MMSNEAKGHNGGQNSGLPAGVHERASWRPLSARAAESLLSGALKRHETFVHRAARLSAWHEQFARRAQPWSGWSPMSLEYSVGELQAEGRAQSTRASESGEAPFTKSGSLVQVQRSVANHHSYAPRQPRSEMNLSRPALRLAVLRPISPIAETARENEPAEISRTHPMWPPLPVGSGSAPELRLVTSARAAPRREVRGGFPSRQSSLPVTERAIDDLAASATARRAVREEQSSPAQSQRADALEPPGAIERLIEQTVRPVALHGLELRLAPPEQKTSADHRPPNDAESRGSAPNAAPAPAPVSPPQLDINAVADKVWQTLQRRQRLERERRGLY